MAEPATSSSSGQNRILYIAGGILAVLLAILGVGIYMATTLLRHVQVQKSGESVTVQTPLGNLQVDKSTAVSTGMPSYPGSVPDDENKSVKLEFGDEGGLDVRAAVYHTPDSVAAVESWYAHHLPPEFVHHAAGEKIKLERAGHTIVETDEAAFVSEKQDFVRFVALQREGGVTKIKLVRIGSREAQ